MSVDWKSKIIKGWKFSRDEYLKLINRNSDFEDYAFPLDAYDENTNYIVGEELFNCEGGECVILPNPIDTQNSMKFIADWVYKLDTVGINIADIGLPQIYLVSLVS